MSDSEYSDDEGPRRGGMGFAALSDSDDDDSSVASSSVASEKAARPASSNAASPSNASSASLSKKKTTTKGADDDDDDDWEALLAREAAANGAVASQDGSASGGKKKKKGKAKKKAASANTAPTEEANADGAPTTSATDVTSAKAEDAAAAYLAQMGIGGSEGGGAATTTATTSKKKKKKGKKKGGAAASGDSATAASAGKEGATAGAPSSKPMSAAARAAKERQARLKEEQERRRREEEERRKVEEEERRIAEEEERKLEEEKRKKREAKAKRIAEQKKAGTYMTKAQRARAAAAQERLAAMRAAGMKVPGEEERSPTAAADSEAAMRKRKQQQRQLQQQREREERERLERELQAKVESERRAKEEAQQQVAGVTAPVVESWEDLLGDDEEEEVPTVGGGAAAVGAVSAPDVGGAWDAEDGEDVAMQQSIQNRLAAALGGVAPTAPKQPDKRTLPLEERIDLSREARQKRLEAAKEARSPDKLRSPICCVMGHVDTGKTKLLDKIRRTNVQEGEAGGITQQIGATWFPIDRLRKSTDKLVTDVKMDYKLPGLLVIDTPGHESFTNLRSRGSTLCDIAVLVIDIMHGLEPQTIESLNLLRRGKTPFIVALNKVDRLYGWDAKPNEPFRTSLADQPSYTQEEFERRTERILGELAQHDLTAKLYYENDKPKKYVSIVPTSAVTGEGVPDLLMLLIKLTQTLMGKKMMYMDYPMATVLEVKTVDGLGTTIDVVLVNGTLHESDTVVVCGLNGPIVTQVRALLTPPPAREIRVKSDYVHHKKIEAAMGVKIAAPDLEKAVAGTPLMVLHKDDEVEDLKQEVMEDLESILEGMQKEPVGVFVQASTLGSLEALLEYLRSTDPPVPVAGVNLGPIHKKHIVEASVMLERKPEYAVILAFDVRVTTDARALATDLGVQIFSADIIYHLTDQFEAHMKATKEQRLASVADLAVFPAACKILPGKVFNQRDPIVLGVEVTGGSLRVGTPMCVITGETIDGAPMVLEIGKVASIEHEHRPMEQATVGGPPVAIKIEPKSDQRHITVGRHFEEDTPLYSRITRDTIDCLKEHYRSDMEKSDWQCIIQLKKIFKIS